MANGVFIYPKDEEITQSDLKDFLDYYQANQLTQYKRNMQEYLGNHPILNQQAKGGNRPDNRLVANLAGYIVDTFNGFFIGNPPKISLDKDAINKQLQVWLNMNSFYDKLSEISKQADVYGRSYLLAYQDEESQTRVAVSSPENSFLIYDDTVAREPYAFVRFAYDDDNKLSGTLYRPTQITELGEDAKFGETSPNVYQQVPAAEFIDNEERTGVFDPVVTLIDALDKVLSQKANQNEYFDNAYLKLLGMQLPEDNDGHPLLDLNGNQIIYAPDANAGQATAEFISKPDGDTIQEHLIDRLVSLIYQVSMVANLNDEAFSGNSSGVALEYKLLPMRNKAVNKERKFTQALRQLFGIIFAAGTVLPSSSADAWADLSFKFTQNIPENVSDEATTAKTLQGIVSQETQLGTLSFVDDPKAEIKRMQDEQTAQVQNAVVNNPAATDQDQQNQQNQNEDQENPESGD